MGMRWYKNVQEKISRKYPDGKAPEGWDKRETDEQFSDNEARRRELLADQTVPLLAQDEYKLEGYPWFWKEVSALDWGPKDFQKLFVGASPPTESTVFSHGFGPGFDGNSVLLQLWNGRCVIGDGD